MRRRRSPDQSAEDAGLVLRIDLDDPDAEAALPVDDERAAWVVGLCDGVPVGERLLPADTAWRFADLAAWARRAFAGERREHEARRDLARALGLPAPPWGAPQPRVSVVVCTRDRPDQLAACLDALARLDPPAAEVLVVDNAPRDDATRALCAAREVRYVLEPHPGQTRARNRGVAESTGEVVAFTDDDCVPDRRWLAGLAESFADPLTMAVTGYVGPLELATEAQLDFEVHGGFERHRRPRVFDAATGSPVLGAATAGAGANMLLRRTAFDHVGGFAEDLGPGTPARSSDDKYFFYALLRAGWRIRHDPGRVVWHRHRPDAAGLRRIFNDYGVSEFAWTWRLLREHREVTALKLWRWWIRHYAGDVRRRARRAPTSVPLALTAQEARGALRGPRAMRRSERSRAGLPPVAIPPSRGAAPDVRVTRAELPGLSVAVASYQRRDSLRETLRSLAAQEHPRFEVEVVLDGSTDGSGEMARALELPYSLRVHDAPHAGLAVTRNRGAAAARQPVVVFLDDDLRPAPGFLLAHGESHRDGPEGMTLGYYPPASGDESAYAVLLRAWWEDHFRRLDAPGHAWTFADVCDGNSSIPVARFDALGRFDEDFSGGRRQDYELGQRLLEGGVPLRFRRDARAVHHFDASPASAIRNARAEGRFDVLLCRKHPALAPALPLARVAALPHGALAMARGALLRSRATPAALSALEATGARGQWQRVFAAAWAESYRRGVLDGLGGGDGRELLRSATALRGRVAVDLDGPPVALERLTALPVLELRRGARVVAEVEPRLSDGQWDAAAVLEQLLPHV